jgi:hypothetical protein
MLKKMQLPSQFARDNYISVFLVQNLLIFQVGSKETEVKTETSTPPSSDSDLVSSKYCVTWNTFLLPCFTVKKRKRDKKEKKEKKEKEKKGKKEKKQEKGRTSEKMPLASRTSVKDIVKVPKDFDDDDDDDEIDVPVVGKCITRKL